MRTKWSEGGECDVPKVATEVLMKRRTLVPERTEGVSLHVGR